jgi:predicted membrane protein
MTLVAAIALLAVVGAVVVSLSTGSSLRHGFGDRAYAPSSLSAVEAHYQLSAGRMNVDLSQVTFPARGKTVDIRLAMGNLTVELPRRTVVTVDAEANFGQVVLFGQKQAGTQVQSTVQTSSPNNLIASGANAPHLTVDAHVSVGQIMVTWGH